MLANYMVAELAARHVKMVLTGEGGDELFAGYARYAGERLSPLFGRVPARCAALARRWRHACPACVVRRSRCTHSARPTRRRGWSSWFPLFTARCARRC